MRRALLVGIDHYPSSPLHGCVADATAMRDMLATHNDGSRNWDTQLLVSTAAAPAITKGSLLGQIKATFESSKGHDVLFYFAGHGAQTAIGAEMVTPDATPNSLGVPIDGLMTLANNSPARSVTIILDCCFSGEVGNVPGLQSASVDQMFRLEKTLLREDVTVLAASLATQTSAEVDGHGVFTRLVLDGLAGGATDHLGRIDALGLYSFVNRAFDAFDQRPILKTSMTEPLTLRVGPPWIDGSMLRDLTTHFPTEDSRVTLTPAHEGDGRPLPAGTVGTSEQKQFDYFGRLRNANLATSDDDEPFYWVAMNSRDVYLTPIGRYFWRLAADNRL
jgi:hypothetical protein